MQTTASLLAFATTLLTNTVVANKMTPIFGTVAPSGATSCTGQTYDESTMFVAIDPSLFTGADTCPTSSAGTGYSITIQCNGKSVQAQANDKCMGCDATWIDVAPAVWEACGYEVADTDPKEIAFTLS